MNTVDIKTVSENGNDPAYPTLIYEEKSGKPIAHREGLTKREMFAMAAMQGLVSGYPDSEKVNGHYIPASSYSGMMKEAVELADELLKQLES